MGSSGSTNRRTNELFGLRSSRERLAGVLCGVYMLLGRWSFARLEYGQDTLDSLALQVGNYVLMVIALVTLFRFGGHKKVRSRCIRPMFLVPSMLVFLLYEACAAAWSPPEIQTLTKTVEIVSLAIIALSVSFWSSSDECEMFQKWFLLTYCAVVMIFGVLVAAGYGLRDDTRTAPFGGGPNPFGRNVGIACFGALWLVRKKIGKYWSSFALLSPVLVLMSGSRGALVALSAGALTYITTELRSLWKRGVALLVIVVGLMGIIDYTDFGKEALSTFERRVLQLTIEDRYDSQRSSLAETAFIIGLDNLVFGAGLASFAFFSTEKYAHNIFLEVFSETGIIGVLLLLVPLLIFLRFIVRNWSKVDRLVLCSFVVAFTHAQFSGSLFDSRNVLVFLILASTIMVVPHKASTYGA